jgi:hypothetical protein
LGSNAGIAGKPGGRYDGRTLLKELGERLDREIVQAREELKGTTSKGKA